MTTSPEHRRAAAAQRLLGPLGLLALAGGLMVGNAPAPAIAEPGPADDALYGNPPHADPLYGNPPHADPLYGKPPHADPLYGKPPHGQRVYGDLPPADALALGPISVTTIRRHFEAGDEARAIRVAEALVAEQRWGRERDAAWLAIGLHHRKARRHNLASEAFTHVRSGGGPLQELAAYYEAEQDLERGRESTAIRECETFRKTWPTSQLAPACLRIIARAHARIGNTGAARAAAREYDREHDNATITEQIDLTLATELARVNPAAAVPELQRLALDHAAPLTGRVAEEELARLRAEGLDDAVVPDDTPSLQRRAASLRDVKRKDAAWAVFETLEQRAAEDPTAAGWLALNGERFGWRTHRWDWLAQRYAAAYDADADSALAWSRFRVLDRGGRHDDAADVAIAAQKAHGASREWRQKEEDVGRTLLLAGRYPEAKRQFDVVAARGGWTGKRGAFFAAFAALMGGDAADADQRFGRIIERDSSYRTDATYWRARARDLLERHAEATADRTWILENDGHSWYALMVRQHDESLPQAAPLARSGAWVGPPPQPEAVPSTTPRLVAEGSVPPLVAAPVEAAPRSPVSLAGLTWPMLPAMAAEPRPSILERVDELHPPASYRASALVTPEDARAEMVAFIDAHGEAQPALLAIHDLASVGLYDLSGPMMSRWYEAWKVSWRAGQASARRITGLETGDWRRLFVFTRDHHHTARFTYDWWESLDDPSAAREAWRLAHPLAHDHEVWHHGRQNGIDPYLVMGLMRQESTYNAVAVSRVGASGAMQIMPTTGHLLADLAHDTHFTAGDLEDPTLSVAYGIRYLGLLMRRFEGVYPLAVASYNGGPHNVSAWLAGTGLDMPIDAFVEHIPYRETRDYVKKVSEGYAAYVDLYANERAAVVVPATARADHPEIVDF